MSKDPYQSFAERIQEFSSEAEMHSHAEKLIKENPKEIVYKFRKRGEYNVEKGFDIRKFHSYFPIRRNMGKKCPTCGKNYAKTDFFHCYICDHNECVECGYRRTFSIGFNILKFPKIVDNYAENTLEHHDAEGDLFSSIINIHF